MKSQCVLIVLTLLIGAFPGYAEAVEPRLEWSFDTGGKIYAPPMICDLDNDGVPEVLIAASRSRRILCLDGRGRLRWEFQLHAEDTLGFQSPPSVVDYDGDGYKEVFCVDHSGMVLCIDHRGALVWRRQLPDQVDYSGFVLADIDLDGRVELLTGSESGSLYCLDDTGAAKWHYQGTGEVRGIPALAHNPKTGTLNIIAVFGEGAAVCLDSGGAVLWHTQEATPNKKRWGGAVVGDIDGDGQEEAVLTTEDMQVVVRDAQSGAERWRWKGQHQIDQTNSLALADFDGTGHLDIVCGDGSGLGGPGNVYRLRDGKALWTANTGGIVLGPSIGDVDGDGRLEILATSRDRQLVCLSEDGQQEWRFPTDAGSLVTPALGDVDGDGEVEIVFASKDRKVYCVSVGGRLDVGRLPWPMINRDPQLSGNWQGAPAEVSAAQTPHDAVEALSLKPLSTLATGGNTLLLHVGNDSHRPRILETEAVLEGPDGWLRSQRTSRRFAPYETQEVRFQIDLLLPGTYTLDLRLLDTGTGRELIRTTEAYKHLPFASERKDLEAREARIRALSTQALGGEAVYQQSEEAFESQLRALPAGAASAVRGEADVSSQLDEEGLRAAVQAVQAHQEALRRLESRLLAARATPGQQVDFGAVLTDPMTKVFRDEPFLTTAPKEIPSLSMAANEYESIQLVLVPLWKDLEGVRVSAGDLAHSSGAGVLPAADISVYRVDYVEIGPPEYDWNVEKLGYYPDVLYPENTTSVPASQDAQPFFLTVRSRPSTPPGIYSGVVRVEAKDYAAIELPLSVQVYDFVLPDETHLDTSLWISEGFLKSFYKYPERVPFAVRKRWYDFHLDHRVGPLMNLPLGGGRMLEDFEYVMARGQNVLFISLPARLSEEEKPAFAAQLRETYDLLVAKGWADKALFYTRDEIAVMGRTEIPDALAVSAFVRESVPEIPLLQTSAPENAIVGLADIWCPTIDHFDPAFLAERMAQGDRLWFYTVWKRPGIMIEFPAVDYRTMLWQCWKYGAEGFLYWGTTHWAYNVEGEERWPEAPWKPWNRQPGHNGCGYLIYPGPNGEPVDSIRFSLLRDGIEDYEYLYLLNTRYKVKGSVLTADLRGRIDAALGIDPGVLTDHKNFTDDPAMVQRARHEIAELIEALAK